jgi:hypothetical protein
MTIKDETKVVNQVLPKPKICCVDLADNVSQSLVEAGFPVFNGTLGSIREVPNKRREDSQLLLPDYEYPDNFHEYDILIIDLTNEIKKEFKLFKVEDVKSRSNSFLSLACRYPANLFDPRPISASILAKKIAEVQNKKFIQIVFASKSYDVDYEIIEISETYPENHPNEKYNLYSFNNQIPLSYPRSGSEISICLVREDISNFLKKHATGLNYEQTFNHPTDWDKEQDKYVPTKSLLPLIRNINDEIVSFVQVNGYHITFVFPNIKNKEAFISDFFKTLLPSLYPDVFPFSTQFMWVNNSEYSVPNHEKILAEKAELLANYEKSNLIIENKISDNRKKYKFLHDLLTETDDKLVLAVFAFLKFLEFKNVILKDEQSKSIKEEDIQVEFDNGILVIETKGIGGTSTDSDCSQISKIKHRRCKERKSFDVWALYIVNHQRFLPPLNRKNPPFTENQIADAINDERGLLTTWQLFNLYNEIQTGIISKEQARLQILDYGLVVFKPKVSGNIGIPKELFKAGQIAIVDLINTKIKVGDTIILEKNSSYRKTKILSIHLNNINVDEASDGEVGIKLESKITKGTNLWKE